MCSSDLDSTVVPLYGKEPSASFPSDHALGGMSVALGLWQYNNPIGLLSILLALLMGFSRIYVGHHYPMDVLGGFCIAFITRWVYNRFIQKYIKRFYKKVERATPILKKRI